MYYSPTDTLLHSRDGQTNSNVLVVAELMKPRVSKITHGHNKNNLNIVVHTLSIFLTSLMCCCANWQLVSECASYTNSNQRLLKANSFTRFKIDQDDCTADTGKMKGFKASPRMIWRPLICK